MSADQINHAMVLGACINLTLVFILKAIRWWWFR